MDKAIAILLVAIVMGSIGFVIVRGLTVGLP